jgi:hypothetical protein
VSLLAFVARAIGSNLSIVVKPDHLRHDGHPPKRAYELRDLMDAYYVGGSDSSDDVVKVVLTTDGGRKSVRLPCTGIGFDGHELHVFAEVEQ